MQSDRPTVYLSNWSSHRTPGAHGPGRKWTIMALPRLWERGAGVVHSFVPPIDLLRAVKTGDMPFPEYARRLRLLWAGAPHVVAPGRLWAQRGVDCVTIEDGDTLCCACAVGQPCHRQVAAEVLDLAGWRVVLDREVFAPST
jgi:hypothetical protein